MADYPSGRKTHALQLGRIDDATKLLDKRRKKPDANCQGYDEGAWNTKGVKRGHKIARLGRHDKDGSHQKRREGCSKRLENQSDTRTNLRINHHGQSNEDEHGNITDEKLHRQTSLSRYAGEQQRKSKQNRTPRRIAAKTGADAKNDQQDYLRPWIEP